MSRLTHHRSFGDGKDFSSVQFSSFLLLRFVSWTVTRRLRLCCHWVVWPTAKCPTSSRSRQPRRSYVRNCQQNCSRDRILLPLRRLQLTSLHVSITTFLSAALQKRCIVSKKDQLCGFHRVLGVKPDFLNRRSLMAFRVFASFKILGWALLGTVHMK